MKPKDMEGGLAAYFEQDHRDCDARWADVEELLDAADIDLAHAAWQKYDASLRRHIAMEEKVLFPAFEAKSGAAGASPVAIMKMEHQQMVRLLEQIGGAMDAGNADAAMDAGDTLLMLTQQHNAKEEELLYPLAQELLASEWDELVKQLDKC